MNQQDLRVIKTKRNIEASFLRLLREKSFYEITVQNILDGFFLGFGCVAVPEGLISRVRLASYSPQK